MKRTARLPGLEDLTAFASLFEFRTVSRWVGLGILVGVLAGLGAALFFLGTDAIRHVVFGRLGGVSVLEPAGEASLFGRMPVREPRLWIIVLAPALGGLASGILMTRLAPRDRLFGNQALIQAFHRGTARLGGPIVQALASVIVIGTGGSAGREGPISQMGAAIGLRVGGLFKLSERERRLLLIAGAAGGIGAIFRTPLGAALFVVEVLYQDDFEVDALVPAVFASVVGYSTFTLIFGETAMFATEGSYEFDPRQLPLYLVMSMGVALVAVIYIKTLRWGAEQFQKLRLPRALVPALGGLGVGVLFLVTPHALGVGYGLLQVALTPELRAGSEVLGVGWVGAAMLLGIALLKILTTTLTVGSGGAGGVFGPSVVIGGMVGGSFGLAFHQILPGIVPQPGAFVIVGMACFIGGACAAPISTLVMASEMTGSYDLLVPLMLAEAATFMMMRRWSIYPEQVATRRDSGAHRGEYVQDALEHVAVGAAYRPDDDVRTFEATSRLDHMLHEATESQQSIFPVRGDDGGVVGVVTLETMRAFFFDEDVGKVAIAADCARPFVSVTVDDKLDLALERFASSHYPELPVVDPASNAIIGWLGYEDLMRAYSQEVVRRRMDAVEDE